MEARRIPGGDAVLGLVIDKLLREVALSQARFVWRYRWWIAALLVRGLIFFFFLSSVGGLGYLVDRQTAFGLR